MMVPGLLYSSVGECRKFSLTAFVDVVVVKFLLYCFRFHEYKLVFFFCGDLL